MKVLFDVFECGRRRLGMEREEVKSGRFTCAACSRVIETGRSVHFALDMAFCSNLCRLVVCDLKERQEYEARLGSAVRKTWTDRDRDRDAHSSLSFQGSNSRSKPS